MQQRDTEAKLPARLLGGPLGDIDWQVDAGPDGSAPLGFSYTEGPFTVTYRLRSMVKRGLGSVFVYEHVASEKIATHPGGHMEGEN